MLVAKAAEPYKFIGFGSIDITKPYKFIWFGDIDAPKPCEFIGFGGHVGRRTWGRVRKLAQSSLAGSSQDRSETAAAGERTMRALASANTKSARDFPDRWPGALPPVLQAPGLIQGLALKRYSNGRGRGSGKQK